MEASWSVANGRIDGWWSDEAHPNDDAAMNLNLWSSHHMAKEAALPRRPNEVCLDKAFVLIEGHPGLVES